MKKLVIGAVMAAGMAFNAQAQIVDAIAQDTTTVAASADVAPYDKFVRGSDFNISYNSDSKVLGLSFMGDLNDYLYMGYGMAADIKGFDSFSFGLYLGLGKRYRLGKYLLLQGKIGPYAGMLNYTEKVYNKKTGKVNDKDKYEFAYGANASLAAGIKLWDTKKGNTTFLTVGYYLDAYEFKTEDLFKKGGSWGIGFTTTFK